MKPGWPRAASTSTTIRTASIPRVAALHTLESMALGDHAEVPHRGYLGRRACGNMAHAPPRHRRHAHLQLEHGPAVLDRQRAAPDDGRLRAAGRRRWLHG